jgi:hypothetical protein
MKKFTGALFLSMIAFIGTMMTSLEGLAQSAPDKVDVNINSNGGGAWYGQPWVWVVGVALFIVVIVAITRNGSNRDA